MELNEWYSLIEKKPIEDGMYYVFISNCMENYDDICKLEYKNNQWDSLSNKYEKVLAWKMITKKTILNETKWLKEHISEIRISFHNDELSCEDCCIVETFEECLCEYKYYLYEEYVRFIDGVYVIRII